MKDQINTIREALEKMAETRWPATLQTALANLTQLEAMVGEQEPICWAENDGEGGILWDQESCFSDDPAWFNNPMPLYAAPVAQQPQAKPFGYVSQHTNGTWEFSPTPAGVYPDTAKSITAVYTKQPQAELFQPDWVNYRHGLHDGWAEGYKQGITDERISEDNIGIAGFGAKVNPARENPYKNTAPQQAEAVPTDANLDSIIEKHLPSYWQYGASEQDRLRALARTLTATKAAPQQAEAVPQSWRTVLPGGKHTDKWESSRVADYNQGWNDYRKAANANLEKLEETLQQAEAVPTIYVSCGQLENLKPDPEDEAGTYLPVRKTPKGKFTHPLFAAPQQAEVVPAWTTEQITAVAQPIAMAIAENCRTAPQLVFPHLFLGLKDLLTSTAPQQAEPDDEILKERDDAEDFIDMLLDEVLGTDRPEWTSAYGRDDALRDVQDRMTALHKPTVDKAWAQFERAQQPQAEAVPVLSAEAIEEKASAFYSYVTVGDDQRQVIYGHHAETFAREIEGLVLEKIAAPQQAEAVRPTTQQVKAAWASPDLPLAPPTPIYNFVDRLFDAMQIKQAEAVPPIYYMRDNHTLKCLSGCAETAMLEIEQEFNSGWTHGTLCSKRKGFDPVHANGSNSRLQFFAKCKDALDAAIAQQKG